MLKINADTRLGQIDGVVRVYNGREPGSVIHYGSVIQHHELIYKWSGDSISRLGEREYALSEGSVLYLPQGWRGAYSVKTLRKGEAVDILFQSDTPLADEPLLLPAPHKAAVAELFERCHEAWRMDVEQKQLRCLAMTYTLLAELADEARRLYATPRVRALLERAVRFLDERCFSESLDCAQLSALTGVSYSYLKKLFVARYGLPPSRYVLRKRMEYAKTLLLTPELSVTEISRQVGYASVYYFSRVFRAETGMTPTEYRRGM